MNLIIKSFNLYQKPKYLSLKKELIDIIIELSGYDFYQGEIL